MDNQHHSQLALPSAEDNQHYSQLRDRPLDWMKAHPMPTAIAGLMIVGMFSGGGNQASQSAMQRGAIQQFNDQSAFSMKHEEQKMRFREEQFRIAVSRQQTCLKVTLDGGNTPGNIAEGIVFRDPNSGTPFPRGTFVCDQFGATAELDAEGRMTNIMFGLPDPGVTLSRPTPQIELPQEVKMYAPKAD